jgi:hypothetical protein
MQFQVILTCTVEQVAEFNVEAEDFEAAKAEAKRRFDAGDADWQDNSVEYGTHEIHCSGGCVEFRFDEEPYGVVNGAAFLAAVREHEAKMGPEKLAAARAAAQYKGK